MSILERFRATISSLNLQAGRALVAVSGGADSVALLDLLVRSREQHQLDLIVAHLDHGIHPESALVAARVGVLAASYSLRFETAQVSLGRSAGETLARARRYAWLEEVRGRFGAGLVFTAHHADDQVETVLMRVLAGSGLAGLAGMSPATGFVVRPLLSFRRAELAAYVADQGLSVWSDPANADPRHLRSWIRTQLLPLVHTRLPRAEINLERLATHAARDRAGWNAVLDVLPGLDLRSEPEGISVAAAPLADYDSALIKAILPALARRVGCQLGPARTARIVNLLRRGASGARAPLGAGWSAELGFGRLHIHAPAAEPAPGELTMEGGSGAAAWGRWRFRWEREAAPERQDRTAMSAWFAPAPLTVRAWAPGEKVKPLGGSGRRLIVRCFQDQRVPRGHRRNWPVLAQSHQVIWIPGVCRSDAGLPAGGVEALRVDAEHA